MGYDFLIWWEDCYLHMYLGEISNYIPPICICAWCWVYICVCRLINNTRYDVSLFISLLSPAHTYNCWNPPPEWKVLVIVGLTCSALFSWLSSLLICIENKWLLFSVYLLILQLPAYFSLVSFTVSNAIIIRYWRAARCLYIYAS